MNEPKIGVSELEDVSLRLVPRSYVEWARENKKRADRLLAAAIALKQEYAHSHVLEQRKPLWIELEFAAIDYEDRRG